VDALLAFLHLGDFLMQTSGKLVCRSEDVLNSAADNESILMKQVGGRYYWLDETGTLIWKGLERPCRVEDLALALTNEFVLTPEDALREIHLFLDELYREGLVEVGDEIDNGTARTEGGSVLRAKPAGRPYQRPRLERGKLRDAASGNGGFYDGGLTSSGNPAGAS
jgi:hypothetical protein